MWCFTILLAGCCLLFCLVGIDFVFCAGLLGLCCCGVSFYELIWVNWYLCYISLYLSWWFSLVVFV